MSWPLLLSSCMSRERRSLPLGWVLLVTDQGQLCRLKLDPTVGAIGFATTQPPWNSPRVEGQLSIAVPLLCLCPLAGSRPISMTSCRRINTALGTMILQYLSPFSRRSRSPSIFLESHSSSLDGSFEYSANTFSSSRPQPRTLWRTSNQHLLTKGFLFNDSLTLCGPDR